jgi:hypothetical protein
MHQVPSIVMLLGTGDVITASVMVLDLSIKEHSVRHRGT